MNLTLDLSTTVWQCLCWAALILGCVGLWWARQTVKRSTDRLAEAKKLADLVAPLIPRMLPPGVSVAVPEGYCIKFDQDGIAYLAKEATDS